MRDKLLPKLHRTQDLVKKQNTWHACQQRNQRLDAQFHAENDQVHDLIVAEKNKALDLKEAAIDQTNIVKKAAELRHYEYQNEILKTLGDLQERKRDEVQRELRSAAQNVRKVYDSQPGLIV